MEHAVEVPANTVHNEEDTLEALPFDFEDRLNFACFLNRLQKSMSEKLEFNVNIDSHVVAFIYDLCTYAYEDYSLLELIAILKGKKIKIDCPLNKKAIVEMIERKNIDIPQKNEDAPLSSWIFDGDRKDFYCTYCRNYIEVYTGNNHPFFFENEDQIRFPDGATYTLFIKVIDEPSGEVFELPDDLEPETVSRWSLCFCSPFEEDEVYERSTVYAFIIDFETKQYDCMYVDQFLDIIDYKDITIMKRW